MTDKEDEMSFEIKSENSQFSDKCKDIFGCLANLEKKHNEYEKSRSVDLSSQDSLQISDPALDETETIQHTFKKPEPLTKTRNPKSETQQRSHDKRGRQWYDSKFNNKPSEPRHQSKTCFTVNRGYKRQRTPDHKINPSKWTKYSLEDVGADDMSESSNTRAAFAFLEERRKLREGEIKAQAIDTEKTSCSKGVITFTKRIKSDDKSKSKGSLVSAQDNVKNNSGEFSSMQDEDEKDSDMDSKTSNLPSEQASSSFKSRKNSRRNIRSRNIEDD